MPSGSGPRQGILACHGITDLAQSEPIETDTPFPVASVDKTFTATAVMRLVADQRVELHAPVQQYLPEFTVADPSASAQITVLNLLNHTAGLDGEHPTGQTTAMTPWPATWRPFATNSS